MRKNFRERGTEAVARRNLRRIILKTIGLMSSECMAKALLQGGWVATDRVNGRSRQNRP